MNTDTNHMESFYCLFLLSKSNYEPFFFLLMFSSWTDRELLFWSWIFFQAKSTCSWAHSRTQTSGKSSSPESCLLPGFPFMTRRASVVTCSMADCPSMQVVCVCVCVCVCLSVGGGGGGGGTDGLRGRRWRSGVRGVKAGWWGGGGKRSKNYRLMWWIPVIYF